MEGGQMDGQLLDSQENAMNGQYHDGMGEEFAQNKDEDLEMFDN